MFGLPRRRLVLLRFQPLEAALLFLELGTHGIGINVEPAADFLRVSVGQHLVGGLLHGIAHFLHDVDPAAVGTGIVHSAVVVEQKVEAAGRVCDQASEGIDAVFADEAVGIMRLLYVGDTDGQAAGN